MYATGQTSHFNCSSFVLVADTDSPPIIGLKASTTLNLIQRVMQISSPLPPILMNKKDRF